MSLGKKDIIKNINSKTHFSFSESFSFLDSFISLIKENKNKKIKIANFGTFSLHSSPQRVGRNPKTKEGFLIEARTKLKFKASGSLKSIIN
jgi:integration host factor subunit alpha